MTGPVYAKALKDAGLECLIPEEPTRARLNAAIFDELCQGIFKTSTTQLVVDAIGDLRWRGADCVILGCTDIPLIVTASNSSLPILDSTRLVASYAVRDVLSESPVAVGGGWLAVTR